MSQPTVPTEPASEVTRTRSRGVVLRLRLVAPGRGRASGTFAAVGVVSCHGTAVAGWVVPAQPAADESATTFVEGAVDLHSPVGLLVTNVVAAAHPVPGTGVLIGGGTWTLSRATGAYDGLRAGGTAIVIVAYEPAGTATVELVLEGRCLGEFPGDRPVSGL